MFITSCAVVFVPIFTVSESVPVPTLIVLEKAEVPTLITFEELEVLIVMLLAADAMETSPEAPAAVTEIAPFVVSKVIDPPAFTSTTSVVVTIKSSSVRISTSFPFAFAAGSEFPDSRLKFNVPQLFESVFATVRVPALADHVEVATPVRVRAPDEVAKVEAAPELRAMAPEASTSIPPAVALMSIASAEVSAEFRIKLVVVLPPVVAKVRVSAEVDRFVAPAASIEMSSVESILISPVPESISIPPAAFEATIRTAFAAASPPSMFTEAASASNVISPADVLKFDAASASREIADVVSIVIYESSLPSIPKVAQAVPES